MNRKTNYSTIYEIIAPFGMLRFTFYPLSASKMKKLILISLFVSISIAGKAQLDTNLVNLLDSMVQIDQKWRGIIRQINNGEIDTINLSEAKLQLLRTDSLNTIKLKMVFEKYGFLGYDIAGKDGSHKFWLLIQHQDKHIDFQLEVLEKMKVAAKNENASFQDYAYLIDRIKVNLGKPQVYGTQMTMNADSTSYIPKAVIEPDKLNKRRKEVGLPPIEFYINAMNERYFGTIKKE